MWTGCGRSVLTCTRAPEHALFGTFGRGSIALNILGCMRSLRARLMFWRGARSWASLPALVGCSSRRCVCVCEQSLARSQNYMQNFVRAHWTPCACCRSFLSRSHLAEGLSWSQRPTKLTLPASSTRRCGICATPPLGAWTFCSCCPRCRPRVQTWRRLRLPTRLRRGRRTWQCRGARSRCAPAASAP